MDSKMVSAMLIISSLAQVSQFASINFSTGIRDPAGVVLLSDSFHQVSDSGICSSFHQEDQHIAWESVTVFNGIIGPRTALTFQYLYAINSTPSAFSVCDLIGNRQLLVIIDTFTSNEASLIAMDDFITEALTPGGELVPPKANFGTASSALCMIHHTSGKVSCFRSPNSFSLYKKQVMLEYIKSLIVIHGYTGVAYLRTTSSPFQRTSPILTKQRISNGTEITIGKHYKAGGFERYLNTYDTDKVLQIGEQMRSNIAQFVSVNNDENRTTHITGLSIRDFEAAIRPLPHNITDKVIPFDGSYDELVKGVVLKTFNAAVGDIVNTAGHHRHLKSFLPDGNAFHGNYSFPSARKLQIGVPVRSNITHFMGVDMDDNHMTYITRFSIAVFEAAVRRLRYKFSYKLIPFYGSSDELVKKVANETFDAAIGDIETTVDHYHDVCFSEPYLKPEFTMVVNAKNNELNKIWWFLSPFTPKLWVMTVAFNALIGVVIWIIEGQEENGPNFIEALFFVHGQPLRSSAARMLKLLWVFVMLILSQVYTNTLTTMLDNSQREPDVDSLKRTNAPIGCSGESQTIWYLVQVLGFKQRNIRIIASIDKYAEALSSGNIKAAFLLTPYAKAFLAEHCADFTDIKSMDGYNLDGFRFVFPKGFPWALEISQGILALKESGVLQLLVEEMTYSFPDCSRELIEDPGPIGPSPFRGFFVICGGTMAIALLITLIKVLYRRWEEHIQRLLINIQLWLWLGRLQRMLVDRELRPGRLHMRRRLSV